MKTIHTIQFNENDKTTILVALNLYANTLRDKMLECVKGCDVGVPHDKYDEYSDTAKRLGNVLDMIDQIFTMQV